MMNSLKVGLVCLVFPLAAMAAENQAQNTPQDDQGPVVQNNGQTKAKCTQEGKKQRAAGMSASADFNASPW